MSQSCNQRPEEHKSSTANLLLHIFKFFPYIFGPVFPLSIQTASTASVFSVRGSKLRSWERCSKQVRQQRTRLYIIWRCTVLLLCWHE
ncbi:hypothetical protein VNO80_15053 [Phaseolus coccineus]|uniref:Uncharacterized protein n=1 Tax=Phaseolus coccineus TaxID=3886 RepID=A0AAN9R1Z4_PHACN